MLGVPSATECSRKYSPCARRHGFSACAGSMRLTHFRSAFCRNRKLGTAFRSPATTLSRHDGVKAPALSLRFHAGTHCESARSETVPPVVGFRHRIGRIQRFRPVVRATSHRCYRTAGPHSPLGVSALRIQAFNRLSCNKSALPDARPLPTP
jgi:hypothetical protein